MALDNTTPESEARRAMPLQSMQYGDVGDTLCPYEVLIYATDDKVGSTYTHQFINRMRVQSIDLEDVTILMRIQANSTSYNTVWQMEQVAAVTQGHARERDHSRHFVNAVRSIPSKWVYTLHSMDGDHTVAVNDPLAFEALHRLNNQALHRAANPSVKNYRIIIGAASYTVTRELRE
jgi:hypothetical protein